MRLADSLPDGPEGVNPTVLPLRLFSVFAAAGMADSALAQFEAYLATPQGSRPRTGPDLLLPSRFTEVAAKMYDQRGDTVRALRWYRELVTRWERADPELQPHVAAYRRRIAELAPVEPARRGAAP